MAFRIDAVRAAYPALAEGFAHFDAAAGSLVARPAADAAHAVMTGAVANKSPAFAPGRRSIQIVEDARAAVADLLGARPEGIAFGNSATSLTYLVSRTLAQNWGPGDEIVLSNLDHDANVRPWVQAAAATGTTVKWARFDPADGSLPAEQYASLLSERTKLVALTAGSNVNGAIPDVARVSALAHEVGALCYVDGVHATPHLPIDVAALGADFYVTSAYKWSGPHLAACAADPRTWERLEPQKLKPSPDLVPERFEFGTPSFASLASVMAAVDHLASLDDEASGSRRERVTQSMAAVHAYEMAVFAKLVSGLAAVPGISFVPAPENRCPTVAFRLDGEDPNKTSARLGDAGVCAFAGDYYAYEFFSALGLRDSGGAVRASVYHYTTEQDVDRLLGVLRG